MKVYFETTTRNAVDYLAHEPKITTVENAEFSVEFKDSDEVYMNGQGDCVLLRHGLTYISENKPSEQLCFFCIDSSADFDLVPERICLDKQAECGQ